MFGVRRTSGPSGGVAAALAAVAAVLLAAPAALAGPDPVHQPLRDGCQRNPGGLLSDTSPEWADVGGAGAGDALRAVEGSATLIHTADEDLPEAHASYDLDMDVVPDAAYAGLLAGSPDANGGQGNGNYAHDADQGKLHSEWESGVVPTFVWPAEGDRVKLWGQWVWDCGHWGQGIHTDPDERQDALIGTGDYLLPGQAEGEPPEDLRGEQTELHPIEAMVVSRRAPWRATRRAAETDVFISDDGTNARAEEECARRLSPLNPIASYGPDYAACILDAGNERQDLRGRSFSFHVPAPPRPRSARRLVWREVTMVRGRGARRHVVARRDGLDVTIAFARGAAPPLAYGASWFVRWQRDPGPAPAHLRFTLHDLTVHHALDPNPGRPSQLSAPPGEYNLYLDLNGYWMFLGGAGAGRNDGSWIPGLGSVRDGQRFVVGRSIDVFLPAGRGVRLSISGRECDLPKMAPCAINGEVSDGNDHPGQAIVQFPTIAAALGPHVLRSPVDDNYELTYSIARVAGVGSGPSPPGISGVPSSSPGGTLGGRGRVR